MLSNPFFSEEVIISSVLDEMANLTPDDTGLPVVIWIGAIGGQHGPRIKVSNVRGKMTDDCFVMSVSHEPVIMTPRYCKLKKETVDDIADWIRLNYTTLMALYKVYETGTGSAVSLQNELKKL